MNLGGLHLDTLLTHIEADRHDTRINETTMKRRRHSIRNCLALTIFCGVLMTSDSSNAHTSSSGRSTIHKGKDDTVVAETRLSVDHSDPPPPHLQPPPTTTPLRITVLVEPSPLTYTSGYTNRFLQLFQYLHTHCPSDEVEIITTEVVVPQHHRPHAHLHKYPIRYTGGFRLPWYNSMTLSWDWTCVVPRRLWQHKPQLLHVTSPGLFVFAAIVWSRIFQIPLVMSYHTHLPVYVRSYLRPHWWAKLIESLVWFLIRHVHGMADLVLVTSTPIQEEFYAHHVTQPHSAVVRVWPKAVDTTRFHPQWKSKEWRKRLLETSNSSTGINHSVGEDEEDPCIVLLYVGRLAPEKRIHELKPIMDALSKKHSNYRLAIVGKGPSTEKLQTLFADDNHRTTVQFLGPLYGPDLQAAYASADIFIMPSDSETLGFVVMEAMASGLPVVAANAGGIPDIIDHNRTGLLVSPSNTTEYVQAITLIGFGQSDRRQRMAYEARLATEQWTWEYSMTVLRRELYPLALQSFHKRMEQRLMSFLFGKPK